MPPSTLGRQRYVDVTAPDTVMINGRLEGGAVVNAYVGVNPYHGSGYRLEVYGKEGTLVLASAAGAPGDPLRILGGRKDDRQLQEIPVPERLTWVPPQVRNSGAAYDVGQMWANFVRAIRTNTPFTPDFDHALRRHRLLDAVARASETGQRQKVG